MTTIYIVCPVCQKTLEGTSDLINWKVKCGCCNSVFIVTFDNLMNSETLIPELKEIKQQNSMSSSEMLPPFGNMKIGRFANYVLRYILSNDICNDEILLLLQQKDYCSKTFHIHHPLIKIFNDSVCSNLNMLKTEIYRYWKEPVIKNGHAIFICSQWYNYCILFFLDWLKSIGLDYSKLKDIIDNSRDEDLTSVRIKELQGEYRCTLPSKMPCSQISTQVFSLDAVPRKLAHTKPISLQVEGVSIPVSSWKSILVNICKIIYKKTPQSILLLVDKKFSRRTTKTIIKQKKINFISPILIANDLWIETNFNADSLVFLSSEIVERSDFDKSSFCITFARKKDLEPFNNISLPITSGDIAFDDMLDRWGEDNL